MTRVVASIEARMGSSRLPGKMLMHLGGRTPLDHLLARVRKADGLDGIVVATTQNPADDAIQRWCMENEVACFRGSEDDVLDRVLQAQHSMHADIVVELCGDTPFLDPAVIDAGIKAWQENDVDLVTTARNRSFPDGEDVEIFAYATLAEIAETRHEPDVREHVSLPFYEQGRYRVHDLTAPDRWQRPDLRLVLDTPTDAQFLGALAAACMPKYGPVFGLDDLLSVLDASAELQTLHAQSLEAAA